MIGCKKNFGNFRTGCVNRNSFRKFSGQIEFSNILRSHFVHKRKYRKLKMEKRKVQLLLEVFKTLLQFIACYEKGRSAKLQVLKEIASKVNHVYCRVSCFENGTFFY